MTLEQRTFEIKEQISPELLTSLMFQYPSVDSAIQEIIDNSYDNAITGRPIFVYINVEPDLLTISDSGGSGMGEVELKKFFTWGESGKREKLGRYGYGGKAALGFLAEGFVLKCAKSDGSELYQITEDSFDKRTHEQKSFQVEVKRCRPGHGFVEITLLHLKRRPNPLHLYESLGNAYRVALFQRKLAIVLNKKDVKPIEIPGLTDSYQEFSFRGIHNEPVSGWIGKLDLEAQRSKLVRPGIRGYVYGRLVHDELFFGFPEPKTQSAMMGLIGELNIESDEVPLVAAKTDFVRDRVEWDFVTEEMQKILGPLVAELVGEQERKRIPKGDKPAFHLAQLIIRHGFVEMDELTRGVKPWKKTGKVRVEPAPTEVEGKERKGKKKLPRTQAPNGAIGERKRLPMTFTIISRDLGANTRSALVSEEGIKKLCICPNFLGYQAARKLGEKQLVLYIIETAALELAKAPKEEEETPSLEEYWREGNKLLGVFIKAARKEKFL